MASVWLNRLIVAGYWLAVVLWMAVIFTLSAQPYSAELTAKYFGTFNIPVRKIAHMLEYAVLFWLGFRALRETDNMVFHWQQPGQNWLALIICILYALSDEWHQCFVPGRSASLSDVAVDTAGACISFAWLILKKRLSNFFH